MGLLFLIFKFLKIGTLTIGIKIKCMIFKSKEGNINLFFKKTKKGKN